MDAHSTAIKTVIIHNSTLTKFQINTGDRLIAWKTKRRTHLKHRECEFESVHLAFRISILYNIRLYVVLAVGRT